MDFKKSKKSKNFVDNTGYTPDFLDQWLMHQKTTHQPLDPMEVEYAREQGLDLRELYYQKAIEEMNYRNQMEQFKRFGGAYKGLNRR